jgi:hypothetical protein
MMTPGLISAELGVSPRCRGVPETVAVAGQKGVEIPLWTGRERRHRSHNLLWLLLLLHVSWRATQHGYFGRHLITECRATRAQYKNDGGQRPTPGSEFSVHDDSFLSDDFIGRGDAGE